MRILKITLFAVAVAFYAGGAVLCYAEGSAGAEQLFARGNLYYEEGRYGEAIEEYSSILRSGKASAAVYYNLAGAYFKAGELGRSILNYERALSMDPRDADIRANYRFVRSLITGRTVQDRGFWAWAPVRKYARLFTVNEMAVITSFAFFLVFVVLAAAVILPRGRKYPFALAALLLMFIVFSSAVTWHKIRLIKSCAVVVAPQADALFSPFDTATKFFTLHEGTGVMVLGERNGWYRVRRSDGQKGWVRKQDVERM
jgi:tetratricopeptide (TPR) repeat protein